jgi:hypothetical protein
MLRLEFGERAEGDQLGERINFGVLEQSLLFPGTKLPLFEPYDAESLFPGVFLLSSGCLHREGL